MSTLSERAEFLLTGSDRHWILIEIEALEAEIESLKPAPITPVDKLNQGYERAGLSSALVVNNKYGKHSAFGYMGRE